MQAKGRFASVPTATSSRMGHRLHRVFADLAGPGMIASAGGVLYLILFKDDATRIGWIYALRSKSAADLASATKEFRTDVGGGVKQFRTDNGTEFVNETFASLCREKTIYHELTGVDRPKHNGAVSYTHLTLPTIYSV